MKFWSPIKKLTIHLVTILVKLIFKRKKVEIDMRRGMIDLPNVKNTK